MSAPFLRQTADGVILAVKIQPRASRNQIGPVQGNELKISVTAPPVDSAANEAVLRFIAETLACHHANVRLIRGEKSRHKAILISGMTAPEILGKIPSK